MMHALYKKTLVALILLLVADALVAVFCIHRSHPSAALIPKARDGVQWRAVTTTDAALGGTSTMRILEAGQRSLRFDFTITDASTYPFVSADMLLENAQGDAVPVDLSRYTTVTFVARCAPANSLLFSIPIFAPGVSTPGAFHTYPSPLTYFSCTERGTPVSLDLTRLAIPPWWFGVMKVDPSRQAYRLDRVAKFVFGISGKSPHDVASHVEIGEFTLHGRDDRYLVALAVSVGIGWVVFAVWFVRAHNRALVARLDAQVKSTMQFVAYRQLTLEPFKDKEKAAVLQFIGTHYLDPELDMGMVAARIGADREKINEILKTELGMTFKAYVNTLRLTEAARLLTETADTTIVHIALSAGFGNVSYFNKLFKEEYGCTPKAFRSLAAQRKNPALAQPQADLPPPS